MAEFIDFEAEASDGSEDEEAAAESDEPMIDDSDDLPNNDVSFFRFFNQANNSADVLARINEKEREAALNFEPNNYSVGWEEEEDLEIDEEASSEINQAKFEETLINPVVQQTKENSFISALIYAINYHKNKEILPYSNEELETKISPALSNSIKSQAGNCIRLILTKCA